MGTAIFETPDGLKEFEIAGEKPTEQETELIHGFIFGQNEQVETPEEDFDISTASFEELQSYFSGRSAGGKQDRPTNEGEVEGVSFQYNYAKADNDKGRAMRLAKEFGPGTFRKASNGEFMLLLDEISPEKKQQYNLPDSGTIYVNRPGGDILGLFDFSDVVGFGGAYQGPILASTAAAITAGSLGAGIPLAAAIVGLGAGGGKAFDEFIEEDLLRDLQDQGAGDVWKDVAFEAGLAAGGDLVLGGLGRGIRAVVKGRGKPDPNRIFELQQERGLSPSEARKQATQEARTEVRTAMGTRPDEARIEELIAQGATPRQARKLALKEARELRAVPAIGEATGKSILARLQGIYEAILPTDGPAIQNAAFVDNLLKQYTRGEISQNALDEALQKNSELVMQIVKNTMQDKDEAYKLANQQLKELIDTEIDGLQRKFTTANTPDEAEYWQGQIGQKIRLWQQNNAELYHNAEKLLSPEDFSFNIKPLLDEVDKILERPLSSQLGLSNKPLFQFIKSFDDRELQKNIAGRRGSQISLSQLNAVRQALQAHGNSDELVGSLVDHDIKNITKKITGMMDDKAEELYQSFERIRAGGVTTEIEASVGPTTKFVARAIAGPAIKQRLEGIELLKQANDFYRNGRNSFDKGKVTGLSSAIDNGMYADMIDVAENVIKDRRPNLLKSWLDDVEPFNKELKNLPTDPAPWRAAARAAEQGNIDEVMGFLTANKIPSRVVGRPMDGVSDVIRAGDTANPYYPLAKRYMDDMAKTLSTWADDMAARQNPFKLRETNRNILANVWFKNALETSNRGGVRDASSFADKFENLGTEVQDLLFGEAAKDLRPIMRDFHLLGPNQQAKLYDDTLGNITNLGMKDVVSNLRNATETANLQSKDVLFQAIRAGRIANADELVLAATKEPAMVASLKRVVGDEEFDKLGGLRDRTMEKILVEAMGGKELNALSVSSGDFGKNLRSAIETKDRNALNEIFGNDTIEGLLKVADDSIRYSNAAQKGKSGLAPAAFAAAFGLRLMTEPVSALTEAASILVAGRVLRNRHFLNWMTKPTIRAADAERSLKFLTEEILEKAQAAGQTITREQAEEFAKKRLSIGTGPSADLNLKAMKIKEMIGREARAVASMSIGGGMREVSDAAGEFAGSVGDTLATQEIEEDTGVLSALQAGIPAALSGIAGDASNVLRQVEEAKMTGIYPGQ